MNQHSLRVEGTSFRDCENREVFLRGINVAGDAKFPKEPNRPPEDHDEFFNGNNVSFVGRPFPLKDADIHFSRLRNWGYNTIRYIFTWEAIEHSGPGIYDEEWLAFTIDVLRVAKKYQFYVFMDPHQDVWSRLSGGSGAPAWTLYAAGLNPRNFQATQAALSQHALDNPTEFPKMLWCTNYSRLVCQTMFTLFWAGRDFAPNAILDDMNIQDYLQSHFIGACKHLAQKIHDAGDLEGDVVIGWESLNEPHRGLIGVQDISKIPNEQHLQLGTSPTAFQGILIGSGQPCQVATWSFKSFGPRQIGEELINPRGASVWLPAGYSEGHFPWRRDPRWRLGECIWAQHGVWDPSKSVLLQKDYFAKRPDSGEILDYGKFTNSYFLTHYRSYKHAIRSVCGGVIMFCQPPVMEIPPNIKGSADDDPNMVHAVHFYDGLTLLTKHWLVFHPQKGRRYVLIQILMDRNRLYNLDIIGLLRGTHRYPFRALKFGERSIRKSLRDQLRFLRDESLRNMGHHPLIFTEIGIPYDLDDKHAFNSGDYTSQIKAMDANHFALEGSSSNGFTLWCYVAQNDHEGGDQWNGEDLSIYSQDDLELPRTITTSLSKLPETTLIEKQSDSMSQRWRNSFKSREVPSPGISFRNSSARTRSYRAAEAFVRPSPIRVHGKLESHAFDLKNCKFSMKLHAEQTLVHSPSEIYLPYFHFPPASTVISANAGSWEITETEFDRIKVQCLRWWHPEGKAEINVKGLKH
ncbi:unnamed protein product [Penicillium olsonii]|nr:unnamed protein product [Penicillium olsonii]